MRKETSQFTELLRTGNDPLWIRLREILKEKGIEIESSVLVESHEDDENFEYGILLTEGKNVFEFGFSYLDRKIEEGILTEWKEITGDLSAHYHRGKIETVLKEMI